MGLPEHTAGLQVRAGGPGLRPRPGHTDDREAIDEGLTCSVKVAHYFGMPEEFVGVQAPLDIHL